MSKNELDLELRIKENKYIDIKNKMLKILRLLDKDLFNDDNKIRKLKIKPIRKAYEITSVIERNVNKKNKKIKKIKKKYYIKKSRYDKETNILINSILENIGNNGFTNIPDENVIIINDNEIYNVSEDINIKINRQYNHNKNSINNKLYKIKRVNYKNILDVINCCMLLNEFDNNRIDKEIIENNYNSFDKRNYYGMWFDIYDKKKEDILLFKKIIEKRIKNKIEDDFDIKYYNEINNMILEINKARYILEKTKYLEKSKIAKDNLNICHHDLEYHNILKVQINNNDDVNNEEKDNNYIYYLIDFEYLIFDIVHHDYSSFLKRVLKSNLSLNKKSDNDKDNDKENEIEVSKDKIKIEMIIKIIINTWNNLDKDDLEIIKSFILFPDEIWQVGYQRYIEKKEWIFDRFIKRLDKAISLQKNKKIITDVFNKL